MNSTANRLRRWSRNVHRELSFFFSGMLLIYAVSGLVMLYFQRFHGLFAKWLHKK